MVGFNDPRDNLQSFRTSENDHEGLPQLCSLMWEDPSLWAAPFPELNKEELRTGRYSFHCTLLLTVDAMGPALSSSCRCELPARTYSNLEL